MTSASWLAGFDRLASTGSATAITRLRQAGFDRLSHRRATRLRQAQSKDLCISHNDSGKPRQQIKLTDAKLLFRSLKFIRLGNQLSHVQHFHFSFLIEVLNSVRHHGHAKRTTDSNHFR